MGQPAYEQFWEDVTEARTDGRHNRVAVPLFVSDSEGDTDSEEICQTAPDNAIGVDERPNDDSDDDASSAVEGWQGQESDHDSVMGIDVQSDIDSDLEFEKQKSPDNTQ